MVKAKFRDTSAAKTDVAMKNEVLCKFLCHNIIVVHQARLSWASTASSGRRRRAAGRAADAAETKRSEMKLNPYRARSSIAKLRRTAF